MFSETCRNLDYFFLHITATTTEHFLNEKRTASYFQSPGLSWPAGEQIFELSANILTHAQKRMSPWCNFKRFSFDLASWCFNRFVVRLQWSTQIACQSQTKDFLSHSKLWISTDRQKKETYFLISRTQFLPSRSNCLPWSSNPWVISCPMTHPMAP